MISHSANLTVKERGTRRAARQRKHHDRESYAQDSSFWQGGSEPLPTCAAKTHLMPDGAHSHCARAEYVAMLTAALMVFNWKMILNSGKVDCHKGRDRRRGGMKSVVLRIPLSSLSFPVKMKHSNCLSNSSETRLRTPATA